MISKKVLGRILVKALWASYFLYWTFVNIQRLSLAENPWKSVQVILIVQCSMIAFFFIIRSDPKVTSWHPYDFIISTIGTFTPFLFLPVNHGTPNMYGKCIQILGSLFTLGAFLSLRRSVGFLPANRGVKSGGMYRVIRHPVYFSYQVFHAGYLMNQWSLYNLAVALVGLLAEVLRIFSEEKILLQDPDYAAYQKKVKWRLIPFIF